MYKNGWILLLILLCVAFLVSCGKKEAHGQEMRELVKAETEGNFPLGLFLCHRKFRRISYGIKTLRGIALRRIGRCR